METVQGMPVLGLIKHVILPLGEIPKTGLIAGRVRSVKTVQWALQNNNGKALLLAQKNDAVRPGGDDFYDVGVAAELTEPMEVNEEIQFIPIAKSRAVVARLDDSGGMLTAEARLVQDEPMPSSEKGEAVQLSLKLLEAFEQYCGKTSKELSPDDQTSLANETEPGRLADRIAFYCYKPKPKESRHRYLTYQQLQRVLETLDPLERLQTVYDMTTELLERRSMEENLRTMLVQVSILQETLSQLQKTLQDSLETLKP